VVLLVPGGAMIMNSLKASTAAAIPETGNGSARVDITAAVPDGIPVRSHSDARRAPRGPSLHRP
jgi:hypothetical protein